MLTYPHADALGELTAAFLPGISKVFPAQNPTWKLDYALASAVQAVIALDAATHPTISPAGDAKWRERLHRALVCQGIASCAVEEIGGSVTPETAGPAAVATANAALAITL